MSVSACGEGFEGVAVGLAATLGLEYVRRHLAPMSCTVLPLPTYIYVCDSVQMHVPDLIRQVVSSCKCRPAAL